MLMQRVLTAIPLAALVIWVILFQPTSVFDILLTVITLIAGYEWAGLAGMQSRALRILTGILVSACAWGLLFLPQLWILFYLTGISLWWLLVTFYLTSARPSAGFAGIAWRKWMLAPVLVPAAFIAMHYLHTSEQGGWWLMYGLALVWVADIGAYFSGKRFGKKKLLPLISPGKTREGLYGALLATTLYTVVAGYVAQLTLPAIVLLVTLSIGLTIISVSGDLFISLLKREAGLKDTGCILPGHGGILDRIDSVLAAMPVFVTGFHLMIHPVLS